MGIFEKKILDLDRRIRTYTLLGAAFRPVPFPPLPTKEEADKDPAAAAKRSEEMRQLWKIEG